MTDDPIDQTARDKVHELKGVVDKNNAVLTLQIEEARKDIKRLDDAFTESGKERKTQFRWLMSLLVPILCSIILTAIVTIFHK